MIFRLINFLYLYLRKYQKGTICHANVYLLTCSIFFNILLFSYNTSLFQFFPPTLLVWGCYCIAISILFGILKLVNLGLHHMYDTSECIREEPEELDGGDDVCRLTQHFRSRRYTFIYSNIVSIAKIILYLSIFIENFVWLERKWINIVGRQNVFGKLRLNLIDRCMGNWYFTYYW